MGSMIWGERSENMAKLGCEMPGLGSAEGKEGGGVVYCPHFTTK